MSPDPHLSRHVRSPAQSIAVRLGVALGTIVFMLSLGSVACVWALVDIHDRLHAVKEDEEKARSIVQLASAIRDQYAHVAHTIIIANDTHAHLFRQASGQVQALAAVVRGQGGLATSADQVQRITVASREIERLFDDEILALVRKGDKDGVVRLHHRVLELAFQAQSDADDLAKKAEVAMEDLSRHVRVTQHGAIVLTILAHVLALITAGLVGWHLYRSIARPIAALSSAVTRMGTGDLAVQVNVEREDELGRLAHGFNDMARAMRDNQAELLRAARLAGLGRVVAGIAHELNNPVGVILGYAKLLLRRDGMPDPKMLRAIEEEAERCHQVIEGLADLTRVSVVRVSAIPLRPLLDDVVAKLRIAGAPSGVIVDLHGDASAQGDEPKLRQVFTNLLQNAVEACGVEGRVSVGVANTLEGRINVTITDTGSGVRNEDRGHIFEPFFTRKANGTGLGLAIARAIAQAHGGDIALVSSTGGAVFRLTLPASRGESA